MFPKNHKYSCNEYKQFKNYLFILEIIIPSEPKRKTHTTGKINTVFHLHIES